MGALHPKKKLWNDIKKMKHLVKEKTWLYVGKVLASVFRNNREVVYVNFLHN